MSSPTSDPAEANRRSLRAALLSYGSLAATGAIILLFLAQAGLFQSLAPQRETVLPEVRHPEQISAGPSTMAGQDNQNQPYQFTAQSAVQDSDVAHKVHLDRLSGSFQRSEGQVYEVTAKSGIYDTKLETLDLSGEVGIISRNRFTATLLEAHVSVKEKTLVSSSPVNVSLSNGGTIIANGLEISDDGNHVVFLNGVKAKFSASGTKGDVLP